MGERQLPMVPGHEIAGTVSAVGSEVTVLSQSLKKQEDGLRLGATNYYATGDKSTFDALRGRFDIILNTVSAPLPLDAYLSTPRVGGAMVNLGAPAESLSVNVFSLLGGNKILAGSGIGAAVDETQPRGQ